MLRDKDGKKFSKSAGNGIDPIDVINQYGCDALRISLISGISPGNDSRFYEEKIEGSRNLVNKLWNMSRFMLMNIDEPNINIKKPEANTLADEWILSELDHATGLIGSAFEGYNFSYAVDSLRNFIWNDLADWYLEISKIEGNKSEILNYILNIILKLWHPFIPFVTEAIWQEIYGQEEILMTKKYPEPTSEVGKLYYEEPKGGPLFFSQILRSLIISIRGVRFENNIDTAKKINVLISAGDKKELLEQNAKIIKGLWTRIDKLEIKEKADNPGNWHPIE